MKRVVIIGGGFGGLFAAKALKHAELEVVLIDKENHHIFQPLLYQVATAGLSPAEIAQPIRSILRNQTNTQVRLGYVQSIDLQSQKVLIGDTSLPYEFLIVAGGSRHSYFGNDHWQTHAPGLKSIEDALTIRRDILLAFEHAEAEPDPARIEHWLTFVVVGAGPTGVELAGAIAELSHRALTRDFRRIDPSRTRIILVEAGDSVLPSFDPKLRSIAHRALEKLGVEVQLNTRVEQVEDHFVRTDKGTIAASTCIWAAGNQAVVPVFEQEVPRDRSGRILVEPDCSIPGYWNAFVIGDAMSLRGKDGNPLPGVSQVAMQQGSFVAANIVARLAGRPQKAEFSYFDKGSMATIGRRQAVCDLGWLKVGGLLAWMLWLTIHIWYLIGFPNKILVLIKWTWSYLTFQRGARLITERDEIRPSVRR